jgi:hypothetical protein
VKCAFPLFLLLKIRSMGHIDFLSIDTEGNDYVVLMEGLTFCFMFCNFFFLFLLLERCKESVVAPVSGW